MKEDEASPFSQVLDGMTGWKWRPGRLIQASQQQHRTRRECRGETESRRGARPADECTT
jgi:hypothetical protein